MALPPQALILQSGTDPLKVLLGVNPFDSFHTWRESTDPTFSNSLAYFTFYELPVSSLMMVPGARDAPLKTIRSKRLDEFGLPGEGWRVAA